MQNVHITKEMNRKIKLNKIKEFLVDLLFFFFQNLFKNFNAFGPLGQGHSSNSRSNTGL